MAVELGVSDRRGSDPLLPVHVLCAKLHFCRVDCSILSRDAVELRAAHSRFRFNAAITQSLRCPVRINNDILT